MLLQHQRNRLRRLPFKSQHYKHQVRQLYRFVVGKGWQSGCRLDLQSWRYLQWYRVERDRSDQSEWHGADCV